MCTRGSVTSAAPASPSPGSSETASGGTPRLAQRAEEHQRAARRLLGGLEHDGVARRQAGGDHPERDRDREVPRRDDRDDPARRVAERVLLARAPAAAGRPGRCRARRGRSTRGSRSPRRRPRRPPATASRTRARPAPRPPAGARAATARRAAGSPRAPRAGVAAHAFEPRSAVASAASTSASVAFAARATTRSGLPGSVETSSSPSRRSSPIHTGTLSAGRASCSRSASSSRARTGARRSSRIGSLANGFTCHRARGREQLLDRDAARLVGQERVVGGVLQQAPHEVGHAGHEVADRAVGAHAQARAGDRLLQRVAEAAQDLQLEVLVACRR